MTLLVSQNTSLQSITSYHFTPAKVGKFPTIACFPPFFRPFAQAEISSGKQGAGTEQSWCVGGRVWKWERERKPMGQYVRSFVPSHLMTTSSPFAYPKKACIPNSTVSPASYSCQGEEYLKTQKIFQIATWKTEANLVQLQMMSWLKCTVFWRKQLKGSECRMR